MDIFMAYALLQVMVIITVVLIVIWRTMYHLYEFAETGRIPTHRTIEEPLHMRFAERGAGFLGYVEGEGWGIVRTFGRGVRWIWTKLTGSPPRG